MRFPGHSPARIGAGLLIAAALALAPAAHAGKKDKTPPAAPPPAAAEPAPPPAAEPPPEPAAPPEPEKPKANADFKATITHADGSVKSGHVMRVERGEDWYAENGWTDETPKLTLDLESGSAEASKAWTDVLTVDLKYGGKTDMDCTYESSYTPWMYTCALKTTTAVKTADGKTWASSSKYKWRFTFDDGTTEEFYVYKLPQREQDAQEVGLDDPDPENHAIYADLQAKLMQNAAKAVTKIAISK